MSRNLLRVTKVSWWAKSSKILCSVEETLPKLPGKRFMAHLRLYASSCHLLDSLSAQLDSDGVGATVSGLCLMVSGGGGSRNCPDRHRKLWSCPHLSQLQFRSCHFSTVDLGAALLPLLRPLVLQKCPGGLINGKTPMGRAVPGSADCFSEPEKMDHLLVVAMVFYLLKPRPWLWCEWYLNKQRWKLHPLLSVPRTCPHIVKTVTMLMYWESPAVALHSGMLGFYGPCSLLKEFYVRN